MSGDVILVHAQRFGDDRGWFTEVYNEKRFEDKGIDCRFVQDNHSYSKPVATLRGLHFQTPPYAQAKLVRCIRGAIFDVAVDLRKGSPTYGDWVGAELSADNGDQLFIPVGFAHGFVTLTQDVEVTYKVSNFYSAPHDGGVRWDDPAIAIDWPIPAGVEVVLSAKDKVQPALSDFDSPFEFDGAPMRLVEA